MTFFLPHSVIFSGMIQRILCLLCFIVIFIMVADLHKPWICVTIPTMVLHPLKLPGCRNGSGKFKACNLRNFNRRLKLTTCPITIATHCSIWGLEKQKMSAHGFTVGLGTVGWAAGLGWRTSPHPGNVFCGKSSALQPRHILSPPKFFLEAVSMCTAWLRLLPSPALVFCTQGSPWKRNSAWSDVYWICACFITLSEPSHSGDNSTKFWAWWWYQAFSWLNRCFKWR